MKKARVIVTLDCNRKCPNCSNSIINIKPEHIITDVRELLDYDMIMITGGEPMLIPDKTQFFIKRLRDSLDYRGIMYLYTALYTKDLDAAYYNMLTRLNGMQFTVHNEATCQDIIQLKQLSESYTLKRSKDKSLRLSIDNRLYDKYDFSNIDFSSWSVVRKLQWLDECPMPPDEDLILYKL